MTKVLDDDRARQAKPGRPVLYVLIASLLLAGVYLATMVGWSGVTSPPASQPASPTAPAGTAQPATPAQPAAPAPMPTGGGANTR